ncbi:MAG TPA: putative glycolipid-binding domain-containing protein [Candidatus Dormibacteraeota bacterium]|nr:putative glycolipid-binding domain-containing protein [Candidatus Dormibacteraeota bacterium]
MAVAREARGAGVASTRGPRFSAARARSQPATGEPAVPGADGAGTALTDLDGCIDLDIAATPFTNTLPIRRLGLRPGGAADVEVVYIAVPDLRVSRVRQRYCCLRAEKGCGVYLYENLQNGFRAELPVDADGLVLDYPEQWRRRGPGRTTT